MRHVRNVLLAVFAVVAFGPLIALAFAAFQQLLDPQTREQLLAAGPSLRQVLLLLHSAAFALSVAAGATMLGVVAASALWQWSRGAWRHLRWWFLLLLFIPPYLQAQAWLSALAMTSAALGRAAGVAGASGGLAAWWAEVMLYTPMTVGLALLGLCAVEPRLLEAARLGRSDLRALTLVAVPLAWPQIAAAGGLVFLFSLTDYGVPSLLQVSSYPLEIFAYFSGGGPSGGALLLSLPLLTLAVPMLAVVSGGIRAAAHKPPGAQRPLQTAFGWPWWVQLVQHVALLLLAMQLLVPLLVLLRQAGSTSAIVRATSLARSEIATTAAIALAAGLLCLPLAYVLAQQLNRVDAHGRWWWYATLLPAAIPAPLLGIGLIAVWNHPWADMALNSLLLPVLVALARFAPLAALFMVAQLKRIDPLLIDAGRVFGHSELRTWLSVHLPLLAPGLIAGGLLVAALSAGELGGTLIVAPPGRATLAMRIYNYLHYGASENVAGLCLLLAGTALLAAAAAFTALSLRTSASAGQPRGQA
jgi:iron(III) transport system permease protein